MDFIFEFIFEVIFGVVLEGIFGLTINNPKIKTRIKTAIYLLFTGAIVALIIWLACLSSSVLVGVVGLALAVLFLYTAVEGHKNDWKQE